MYVIIYRNAATKNSLPNRLLRFTELEYISARIIGYRKTYVQSSTEKFYFHIPRRQIHDRYFLGSAIFPVILKSLRTANFPVVLILRRFLN